MPSDNIEMDFIIREIHLAIDKLMPSNWKHQRENRPFHGFIYMQSGRLLFSDENSSFYLEADEILYLPKGSSYKLLSVSDRMVNYSIVNFDVENGDETLKKILSRHILPQDKLSMSEKFKKLNELYFYMPSGYRLEMRSYLYGILYGAYCASREHFISEERRLLPAVEYLRGHFDKDCDMVQMAKLCDISVSHFRKLFGEYYKQSPKEYLLTLRLSSAKSLLLVTNLSVAAIAEKTGFGDPAYFCKRFRLATGMTPSLYRKNGEFL